MNGGLLQAEELSDIMITDTKIIYTGGEFRIRQPFQTDPNDPNSLWGLSEADMQNLIDIGTIEVTGVYSIITDGDYTVLTKDTTLVAYYPLDEGSGNIAADASANGHDGTLNGNPVWIAGKFGMALEFSGVFGDHVDLGTWNPSEGTDQLTIALWVKWNGLSGGWQGLISKRNSYGPAPVGEMMWFLEAHQTTGALKFARREGGGVSGTSETLPVGEWQHIAVTCDGTTATMYRDGVKVNSGDFTLGSQTDAGLQIGSGYISGGGPFNGALDEVMLYNRALSDLEVLDLGSNE